MPDGTRSREQVIAIVFQQELPVRLLNISRSGCLLQVLRRLWLAHWNFWAAFF